MTPEASTRCRRLIALAAVAAACSGVPASPEPVHAAAPKPVDGEKAPEPERAPKLPRPDAVRDPLDLLRERLAAKLGARRPASDAGTPAVVRVSAQTGTAAAAEHGGEVPTRIAAPRKVRSIKPAPLPSLPLRPAPWDYAGSGGPAAWGQLQPEFSKCATGTRQSPIDIRDGIKVDLDPVRFDYRPSGFRVTDNGHTVQVNVGAGNTIDVMGRRYELVQFHFHRPSEERIDGRQFEMVVHLVHQDIDGRLAVVAVLLERGAAQGVVQSVWNNLPLEKGDEVEARGALNLADLLPPDRSYFTYMGSLTTPPCSEGVLWMVMKQPVPVSAEQIGIFARLYPMNARPIQSASGRLIKESN